MRDKIAYETEEKSKQRRTMREGKTGGHRERSKQAEDAGDKGAAHSVLAVLC